MADMALCMPLAVAPVLSSNGSSSSPAPASSAGVPESRRRVRRPLTKENEKLYAALAPVVRRVVVARFRNDDEVDDSIHEVFIQIFLHIGSLRDPSCLEPWAERIANNVVNNVLRKRERFRKHSALYTLARRDETHDPDWMGRTYARRVMQMMGRLPASDRDVLWKYWFEPLTHDQMAAQSKCSGSKLTRRIRRALARFSAIAGRDRYLCRLMRDG